MYKWFTSLLLSLFLLSAGCAPNHLYIEEGVIESIDQQLINHDIQLSQLFETQSEGFNRLEASNINTINNIQSFIEEHVKPPVCPPIPVQECPAVIQSQPVLIENIEKQMVGELEKVLLSPLELVFNARIDTGATTSSLDARNIQRFERDGRRWVRFETSHPESGETLTFERPVVRRIRVSQAISDDFERRPVIELHFTLGNISHTAEFSLSDRSHLEFPVLIGRNILRDQVIVDVSQQYIAPLDF